MMMMMMMDNGNEQWNENFDEMIGKTHAFKLSILVILIQEVWAVIT